MKQWTGRFLITAILLGAALLGGCSRTVAIKLGNGVTLDMVGIPAGTFQMGSPSSEDGRSSDEGPVHAVSLDGFSMGKTEVTQAQYEALMGTNPSYFKGAQNPVEQVSWNDATAFCGKLSEKTGKTYTLPTEAQWEYACRAGSTTRFSFGDSDSALGGYAWYEGNSSKQTHLVGQKTANAFGLFDMLGNVWEWCSDWHGESYYASSPGQNPPGPSSGEKRVLRGGSWDNVPSFCRSANRDGYDPTGTLNGLGFRVVCISRTQK
jgi:formylglycine-generating enzyme required for sulfatase activity